MRDALSIMDQAIASAPLVGGKAHLETEQIRELMGSVPNTVFERLMEEISAGQTAAVVTELNTLLNAGNSPSALARQFVRYLRNALMARVGGENTDLLQISADERARAARSAMLFSEEDLTRFLQVMLRTFDDLNYRQEQRFHLELGLVKLVHLQRLLPIEEILSGAQGAGQVRAQRGRRGLVRLLLHRGLRLSRRIASARLWARVAGVRSRRLGRCLRRRVWGERLRRRRRLHFREFRGRRKVGRRSSSRSR
jgi:DNA polymerase III gamma/tau subunit